MTGQQQEHDHKFWDKEPSFHYLVNCSNNLFQDGHMVRQVKNP